MKKNLKVTVMAVILVFAMAFTTACGGTKFDASKYVKSCLDLLTKGEKKEYMEITGRSEEEAQDDYDQSLDSVLNEITESGLSEELTAKYRAMFEDLYKKTKYEVKEAKEDKDGGFTVDVEIEPVTGVFDGITDELQAEADAYANEILDSGADLDEDDFTEWAYNKMYELLTARMDNITYGEKQTVTVHVVLNDNAYEIPQEDMDALDMCLVDTADMTE